MEMQFVPRGSNRPTNARCHSIATFTLPGDIETVVGREFSFVGLLRASGSGWNSWSSTLLSDPSTRAAVGPRCVVGGPRLGGGADPGCPVAADAAPQVRAHDFVRAASPLL